MATTVIDRFLEFAAAHGAAHLADVELEVRRHDGKLHDSFCWPARSGDREQVSLSQLAASDRCRDCLGGAKVLRVVAPHAREAVDAYNVVRDADGLSSGRRSASARTKARRKLAEDIEDLRQAAARVGPYAGLTRAAVERAEEALAAGAVDREQLQREAAEKISLEIGSQRGGRDDTVVLAGWRFPVAAATMRAVVDAWSVRDDTATLLAAPMWTVPWLVRKIGSDGMQLAALPDGVSASDVAALWAPGETSELSSLSAAVAAVQLLDVPR